MEHVYFGCSINKGELACNLDHLWTKSLQAFLYGKRLGYVSRITTKSAQTQLWKEKSGERAKVCSV